MEFMYELVRIVNFNFIPLKNAARLPSITSSEGIDSSSIETAVVGIWS